MPGSESNETLLELVKKCIKGDSRSQKQLYDLFSPKMFGVCLRYAKNYHIAEDLLQEGFIKAFSNLHKFRGEGSFEGWMRRIFINTAIEHFRKNNPLYPVNNIQDVQVEAVTNEAVSSLDVQDLMALVNDLSPGYRMVFNLYVVEGYGHKDIAKMLKINEGTSKSQLARARNILQQKVMKLQQRKYEAII